MLFRSSKDSPTDDASHVTRHFLDHAIVTPGLSLTVNSLFSQAMHRDHQRWYSHRLNRDMGVAIYGHYGLPILAFPTSMGDEHEQEGQGMIRSLGPYIDEGRIRIFCINGVQSESFNNKGAHPFHRSWLQAEYDHYIAAKSSPSSTPNARRQASRLRPTAHRSALITRPTPFSSIPTM